MTHCPSCNVEIAGAGRFCASCGAGLDASAVDTVAMPHRKPPSSSASDEGRFPAGTLLGERYRVLGLLGRGGMGEVYRATDLKLNQAVALKFLPEATARNPKLLERFHGEVRIARQVSHRNVCRVYDLGEVDGAPFISMEYVDGEDLASLLRRIGRLPGDKAVEIARKLCAGLAAAHEKGVLHRDLKPANVMIDGRGQVLIMDFGLAAVAGEIQGGDARSGTPAYMAPEQREGREVSVRSDIYSLGLVIYEMVTGKPAGKPAGKLAGQTPGPQSLSTVVKDADPAVERVIQRCLDLDPAKRPVSALDVARALPGGDPLAEALAAGDTPSPEMVAASDDTGAISVRTALLCLGAILAGLIAVVLLSSRTNLLRLTPAPNSPQDLERTARSLIVRLGYTYKPVDSAFSFGIDSGYQRYAERNFKPEDYRAQIAKGQPSLLDFVYRQSPRYLETYNADANVDTNDPPPIYSEMADVVLDPQGHLLFFRAVPPEMDTSTAPAGPVDWSTLLTAAGLDPARFTPAEPQRLPLASFDERKAWTGSYAHAPSLPLRVEAASWKGRPVFFQLVEPWRPSGRSGAAERTPGVKAGILMEAVIGSTLFLAAALLAWRSYRRGRGDLRGSARLAVFAFACTFAKFLVAAHHVPTNSEFLYLAEAAGWSLFMGAVSWMLYMALEPYVRRRWPQSLISWTRALAGSIRDPLLGGHVLIGTALGVGLAVLGALQTIVLFQKGIAPFIGPLTLAGLGPVVGYWIVAFRDSTTFALGIFFLFFILRAIFRRNWLAAVISVALPAALDLLFNPRVGIAEGFNSALNILIIWLLIRFGVLPVAVALVIGIFLGNFPITSDFSAWYAGASILALATVLAIALWSFRVALGGRQIWKEDFLD
jgi:serine/threonine protein kinase